MQGDDVLKVFWAHIIRDVYMYVRACVYVFMYTQIYVHIHIYIHITCLEIESSLVTDDRQSTPCTAPGKPNGALSRPHPG